MTRTNFSNYLRFCFSWYRKEIGYSLLFLSFAGGIFEFITPFVSQISFDKVLPSNDHSLFFQFIGIAGFLYLLNGITSGLSGWITVRKRIKLFSKIKKILITNLIKDCDSTRSSAYYCNMIESESTGAFIPFFKTFDLMIKSFIVLIVGSWILLYYSPSLLWIMLLLLGLYAVLFRKSEEKTFMILEFLKTTQQDFLEFLSDGIKKRLVLNHFNAGSWFLKYIEQFENKRNDLELMFYSSKQKANLEGNLFSFGSKFLISCYLANQCIVGALTLGETSLLGLILLKFTMVMNHMSSIYKDLIYGFECYSKFQNYLLPGILTNETEIDSLNCIELSDVSIQTPQKQIFNSLSLSFRKGKKYLIKGESGIGKTTLFQLLTGERKTDSGKILFNDYPLNHYSYLSLFQHIRLIPQRNDLFKVSCKENILFSEASHPQIEKEFEKAGLNYFKLDEIFYQGDTEKISLGEARRLVILRSLFKKGEWLIMDEPDYALSANLADKIISDLIKTSESIILFTHRDMFDSYFDEIYEIRDQKIMLVKIKSDYSNL